MKKRTDGRYTKKVTLPDGTKKYLYGTSQMEVNQKAREILNAADAGVKLDDTTTVGEWTIEWFATYKQGFRPSTIAGYKSAYNNHIYDVLQRLPLKQVRQVHIQKVMNGVADNAEGYQRIILNTMRQIFRTAQQNCLIVRDPTEGVKITPKIEDDRILALTVEQQETLLRNVKEPRARLFCAIGLYCGLRRGEMLGLMWSDVVGDDLSVNRSVTFLGNQQDDQHELKNKSSYRTVPIPKPLQIILNETSRDHLYLFTSSSGGPMTNSAFRHLWGHVERAVSFHVHPHMLRHTYATSLYRAGIDIKTAQYLLGHSDIKMTANIYTHIEKGMMGNARQKLTELWSTHVDTEQHG